jgi:hypothetical protein
MEPTGICIPIKCEGNAATPLAPCLILPGWLQSSCPRGNDHSAYRYRLAPIGITGVLH